MAAINTQSRVKDTLEVLDFGFAAQRAITDTLADGKVNMFDVPSILQPLMKVGLAIEGFANVQSELTNIDEFGKAEVKAFVQARFDIADDQVEELVEETINQVIQTVAVAFKWQSFRKQAA